MGHALTKAFSRRSFLKLAAATGAAATVCGASGAPMALAETASEASSGSDVKRVRSCCRACGKMECGVWVTVRDGKVVKVEGDESAFHSRGNSCAKSQSSMLALYHPDRLRYPLKRTNPKDADDAGWERISWDEAYEIIGAKFNEIIDKYGGNSCLAMNGTGRIWTSTASKFKTLFGSVNQYKAGQICRGPRIFAGDMTIGRECHGIANVDDHPNRVYVQWGTACEYSNYDDSCRTIADVVARSKTRILIDPRVTAAGKDADYWINLRPGTDGALALCWTHIVIENELYDDLFVKRWTNAPFLVVEDMEPTGGWMVDDLGGINMRTRLLKESDLVEGGSYKRFMVWDNVSGGLKYWDVETTQWEDETHVPPTTGTEVNGGFLPDPSEFNPAKDPALYCPEDSPQGFKVTLKDGTEHYARPVWDMYAEMCSKYTPDYTAEVCEVDAALIEEACLAWATRPEGQTYGNGGLHYNLATDHCGNSTQTIRAIMILGAITGNFDIPAGNRGPMTAPISKDCTYNLQYKKPGPAWGSPEGGTTFDKNEKMTGSSEFPMARWFNMWSDARGIWDAVHTGEPYPIRGAVCTAGDVMSACNAEYGYTALEKLDFYVVHDLFKVPTAGPADLLLPAWHWLEMDNPRVSQGSGGAMGLCTRAVDPAGEAECDPNFVVNCYKALGKNWGDESNPWPSFEDRLNDGAVKSGYDDWESMVEEFQEHGWWDLKKVLPEDGGTYRRYETGALRCNASTSSGGKAAGMPESLGYGFMTADAKLELWPLALESYGDQGSDIRYDPWEVMLPDFKEPCCSPVSTPELFQPEGVFENETGDKTAVFNCTTGRRIPVFFHNEHRMLPWCREQWPVPRMEIHPDDAASLGIEQGDWVWIETEQGKIRQCADLTYGIKQGVVNLEHQWWYPELPQADKGFRLSCCNCLIDPMWQDPIAGNQELRCYAVKVYKATPENSPFNNPVPCGNDGTEIIHDSSDPRLKEWMPVDGGEEQA